MHNIKGRMEQAEGVLLINGYQDTMLCWFYKQADMTFSSCVMFDNILSTPGNDTLILHITQYLCWRKIKSVYHAMKTDAIYWLTLWST